MKRKFLATILTFAMAVGVVFTGSGTTAMAAESVTELEEKIASGDQMEFIQISGEELPENTIRRNDECHEQAVQRCIGSWYCSICR